MTGQPTPYPTPGPPPGGYPPQSGAAPLDYTDSGRTNRTAERIPPGTGQVPGAGQGAETSWNLAPPSAGAPAPQYNRQPPSPQHPSPSEQSYPQGQQPPQGPYPGQGQQPFGGGTGHVQGGAPQYPGAPEQSYTQGQQPPAQQYPPEQQPQYGYPPQQTGAPQQAQQFAPQAPPPHQHPQHPQHPQQGEQHGRPQQFAPQGQQPYQQPYGQQVPGQQVPGQQMPGQQQGPPGAWRVIITQDPEYFQAMMERSGPEGAGLQIPQPGPGQQLPLTGHQITIGRRRQSTGEAPDIDLGRAPEDPGVSHQHALLVQQPDGSWAVVDQDSTNGTTLNGAEDPIQPFIPVTLQEGDRVHVGAWTTITLHRG
ncbi:FHA domain-containing protein [Streptomyces sp. P38-E01]|uniref:FHA domain-containing protein n=1 Tax=Streptomyces tardus TaxID=2780544 RepID=A0A949JPQ0_9ACTN|nr:FHA domain-containing protein [Streptomyces tardus]